MKSSFETMYSALLCTSLYSDDAENLRAELMAYATVFDEINEELCDMLNERFVCSAESYGLSEIERIIGAERNDLDIYKRRQSLMLRGAINSQCFTPDAIKEALNPQGYNMIVTPKEIDDLIENMKDVIARGINYAV